jgi:deoxyribodipyrimidine photolyase-related protein
VSRFGRALRERQPDPAGRRWLFVPYDQLSGEIGPLSREAPQALGIVLVETPWKPARRPYHKQKLALVLANLRHFALEQAARGVAVRHVAASGPYRAALEPLTAALGPLRVMEPAERELRADLAPLVASGGLLVVPHEGWLTTAEDFRTSQRSGPPWRMDAFYRHVRRRTGLLMRQGKPVGGKFSFDPDNRLPWRGDPPAPPPPRFQPDAITEEVGDLVDNLFARHPGRLDLAALPATRGDAETLWAWAKQECLPVFGPYEDAMSSRSIGLFHTRISALLNLHRLLPSRVVADVEGMTLPIASQEGFIRQVLGWREFVRHVHMATDGFRRLPGGTPPIAAHPGDGGYAWWAGKPWGEGLRPAGSGQAAADSDCNAPGTGDPDGGAMPSALGASGPLPRAYWGVPSGLACLDRIVADVWAEGYSHHITRLMVLANLATLLDVSPRELTDWFWVAYADAYDWVVEPNVLGMGTYAVGDLMTTKPYVAGAAYIARMSDYCGRCTFGPKTTCPITRLYWAFLARHEGRLRDNLRLRLPLQALRKRPAAKREDDARTFEQVRSALGAGRTLSPKAAEKATPRKGRHGAN